MNRSLSEPRFEELVSDSTTDCEAVDVREKLAGVDLDPAVIEAAVTFERERRVGMYTTAIYDALDSQLPALAQQKDELDRTLELAEFMLGKKASVVAEESTRPVLGDALMEKLSVGTIDRATFEETALACGFDQNITSRTYVILNGRHSGTTTLDLDDLVDKLTENDDEDEHPMLKKHGFGPMMLEVSYAVGNAYLTALEKQQMSE